MSIDELNKALAELNMQVEMSGNKPLNLTIVPFSHDVYRVIGKSWTGREFYRLQKLVPTGPGWLMVEELEIFSTDGTGRHQTLCMLPPGDPMRKLRTLAIHLYGRQIPGVMEHEGRMSPA